MNLYAGVGCQRRGWGDQHDVTAIEYREDVAAVYAQNFPDDCVIVGDAHEALLDLVDQFDFIWSSPPCQSHSKMQSVNNARIDRPNVYPDMKLWQEIIYLTHTRGSAPWCVENVFSYYKPVIHAQTLGRHRIWSNFHVPRCAKIERRDVNLFRRTGEQLEREYQIKGAQGLYMGSHEPNQALRNGCHPDIGRHILEAAFPVDLFSAG